MTFGRPAAIPDSYVKLELPVNFVCISQEISTVDPQKLSSTLFYTMTM